MSLKHRTIVDEPTAKGRAMVEEAIETLCQDFCGPNGRQSPTLVNPNPNIVFTVSVDPNSITDDIFLRRFVANSACHSMAGLAENTMDKPTLVNALASLAPSDWVPNR